MYAVIRRYNTQPGMGDRIAKKVREDFLPQLRALPSFVAYYVVNADDDTMASISIFHDRAAAEESNHLAAEWVRRNIATMVKTAPVIMAGDVTVQFPKHPDTADVKERADRHRGEQETRVR